MDDGETVQSAHSQAANEVRWRAGSLPRADAVRLQNMRSARRFLCSSNGRFPARRFGGHSARHRKPQDRTEERNDFHSMDRACWALATRGRKCTQKRGTRQPEVAGSFLDTHNVPSRSMIAGVV